MNNDHSKLYVGLDGLDLSQTTIAARALLRMSGANKLGKGDYAICIGYMLQSTRGEYIAQNACKTGSPLLISLVLARCLNSLSLGSEFEMVVAVCKFSS